MSGEMTVRTTSKAKALMKALNVSVSVLPLLPSEEDNSRRVVLMHYWKSVFQGKMNYCPKSEDDVYYLLVQATMATRTP